MSTFLNRFAVDGRFGKGGGMLGRAKAAGYSDKQIARAITKGGHGLTIGEVLRPGSALHTQMANSNRGRPGNWIFNYMGGSGAVGMDGLNRALGEGRTVEELISAGALTSGGTQNYGVAGFGQKASDYLMQQQEEEGVDFPEYSPLPDVVINMPDPKPLPGTQLGQANVGAGYNALGIKTKQGSDLGTGGTKTAFGREKRKRELAAAQLAINPLTL